MDVYDSVSVINYFVCTILIMGIMFIVKLIGLFVQTGYSN